RVAWIVTSGQSRRFARAAAPACQRAVRPRGTHMMTRLSRRNAFAGGALAMLFMTAAQPAFSEDKGMTTLFKIITVKDEIVIGLSADELAAMGGKDAGAVARSLASKGELTVWQYAVRHGPKGEMQQAPLRKVGLLANASLRVEPYTSTYAVLAHE